MVAFLATETAHKPTSSEMMSLSYRNKSAAVAFCLGPKGVSPCGTHRP